MSLDNTLHIILAITLPKGIKPKVTRKEKVESTRDTSKENNNNYGLNYAKVTPATSDDFINKKEDVYEIDPHTPSSNV